MKSSESRYCKCIYFASGVLARKMEKMAIECWKKIALAPSHGYLLLLVIDYPGIQPGNLSEELQLSPSTITRLIEKLEEKKLVTRAAEGKLTKVLPTTKGKELLPQLKSCAAEFHEIYTAILGKEDSARLVDHMHRMTEKLRH